MGPAKTYQRTILPWFIGVGNDHVTLDIPDSGTWSERIGSDAVGWDNDFYDVGSTKYAV